MSNFEIKVNKVCLLLLMFTLSPWAQAQIVTVNANASTTRVSISSTGHSQVRWNVLENAAKGGSVSINSINGTFIAPDNTVLGTTTRPLQASRNMPVPGNTTFNFVESLVIPQTVIRTAQRRGFSSFFYVRQFSDFPDNTSQTGQVRFAITGGSLAGILTVQRVAMEFDDGRTTAVVTSQSEMRARALIRYNGTGLLEYSWEIAIPPSTQGQAIFVPLISRKQFLLAGQQVVLQTPLLPTIAQGQYLLRLRINKPLPAFELPVLRYAVNGNGQSRATNSISVLGVARPASNATFSNNTIFEWQPVPAAKAYQLELYKRPFRDTDLAGFREQAPITGVLVPAEKTKITVGSLTSAHLTSGENYYWRVIAFSEKGKVIARSKFRAIHLQ